MEQSALVFVPLFHFILIYKFFYFFSLWLISTSHFSHFLVNPKPFLFCFVFFCFETAQEVRELLDSGANDYYSTRYESAYCIYQPNEGQTAAVWYQSAQSLSAKLQLARLFGMTQYILE